MLLGSRYARRHLSNEGKKPTNRPIVGSVGVQSRFSELCKRQFGNIHRIHFCIAGNGCPSVNAS